MAEALRSLPPNSVFLCYRRSDSEDVVDRIYERLSSELGSATIFRDLDAIPPGVSFPEYIMQALGDCLVALIFIGRDWLSATTEGEAGRRIDDPADHVRLEIETALGLPQTRVIPVLVRRGQIPKPKDLPPSLQALCPLNSLEVRSAGEDYKRDIDRFVKAVRTALAGQAAARERFMELPSGATPLSDSDWTELLIAIANDRVVPVLGPDLITFEADAGEWPTARWLASQLATQCGISPPALEAQRPLEIVAEAALREGVSHPRLVFQLRRILQENHLLPSAGLVALATISPWRLFITTALDNVLASAFAKAARPEPVFIRFARSATVDLAGPMPKAPQAVVLQALGALVGSSVEVALTHRDWRDFMSDWHRPQLQPIRLLNELASRRLLFLGGGHPQGFVAFLLQLKRRLSRLGGKEREWITTSALDSEDELGEFSQHRLITDNSTPSFAQELTVRWKEWSRSRSPGAGSVKGQAGTAPPPAEDSLPQAYLDDVSAGSAQLAGAQNPWPGLRPFTEIDRDYFFGRDQELAELLGRVDQRPLTVVFAASGQGKTSLLLAGLAPRLRQIGRLPVVLRLDQASDAPLFRDQAVAAILASQPDTANNARPEQSTLSLWEVFHRRTEEGHQLIANPNIVLIIDQFETLFSRDDAKLRSRSPTASFLAELADLSENRAPSAVIDALDNGRARVDSYEFKRLPIHLIISIREDYLSQLLPWRRQWPSMPENLFRVEPLTGLQALDVLTKPNPELFEAGVAEQLVRMLAGASDRAAESSEALGDLRVPAPLLALMAEQLNKRRMQSGLRQITTELIQAIPQHGVEQVLTDFYEGVIMGMPPQVREWVENDLISPEGFRNSVLLDAALAHFSNSSAAHHWINALVDQRLLAVSEHAGSIRLELANELLAPAVRHARDTRRAIEAQERAEEGAVKPPWWRHQLFRNK